VHSADIVSSNDIALPLGWYVTPFQGLKFCLFLTQGVAPGLVCYAFSGLKILFIFNPGRCPSMAFEDIWGCYVST